MRREMERAACEEAHRRRMWLLTWACHPAAGAMQVQHAAGIPRLALVAAGVTEGGGGLQVPPLRPSVEGYLHPQECSAAGAASSRCMPSCEPDWQWQGRACVKLCAVAAQLHPVIWNCRDWCILSDKRLLPRCDHCTCV